MPSMRVQRRAESPPLFCYLERRLGSARTAATRVLLPLWEKVALAQRASDEGCCCDAPNVAAFTPHPALRAYLSQCVQTGDKVDRCSETSWTLLDRVAVGHAVSLPTRRSSCAFRDTLPVRRGGKARACRKLLPRRRVRIRDAPREAAKAIRLAELADIAVWLSQRSPDGATRWLDAFDAARQ
mgnify:CR=1 FL=1